MLVVEAINITGGGAQVLLEYLVKELEENCIKHVVLTNKQNRLVSPRTIRCRVSDLFFGRVKNIIRAHTADAVLSFGNFPLPFKVDDIPTYTYFHRPHLAVTESLNLHSSFSKISYFLKRRYLRYCLFNCDEFWFQSTLIRDNFIKTFNITREKTRILPFYDYEKIAGYLSEDARENAYLYSSNEATHKNHELLFKALLILKSRGYAPKIYVTVGKDSHVGKRVISLQSEGINIVNLGFISHSAILSHNARVKYVLFPSLRETLGLGLVEAAILGNVILGADLDYTYHAVQPSIVFDPMKPHQIADAIITSQKQTLPVTELRMKSCIKEILRILG